MKLMMSNYDVTLTEENNSNDFYVVFHGPKDTPYEEGTWKVHVLLPEQYPFKSPSIGFSNRIYHPNVDEASGTVCLDVINQAWSPMYELINIFEVFLPQLLQDPNPKDPLNGDAAMLLLKEPEKYKVRVREYVKKYAAKNLEHSKNNGHKNIALSNGNGTNPPTTNNNVKDDKGSVHSMLSNASDNYDSDGGKD